jgi:signal transduction histidine kinase
VEDVVNTYRPQSVNKQLTIELEVDPDGESIEIDPTLIRQAVGNLVDNAIKYTEAGGEVKVECYQLGGQQVIKVRDTGLGIAPADQARLFEKFFRSQRKELLRERGSGLGLAIVKSIVDQHGGRIHVESRLGEGSTFTVRLPISQPKPEQSS